MQRQDKRDAVIAAALSFVGTPFRMQGRLPGVGLDCLGVVACAGRAAGMTCAEPTPRYGSHPDPADRTTYTAYMQEISIADAVPGDVLLMTVGTRATHCAVIVGTGGQVVHALACAPRAVVMEDRASLRWPIVAAYRYREE